MNRHRKVGLKTVSWAGRPFAWRGSSKWENERSQTGRFLSSTLRCLDPIAQQRGSIRGICPGAIGVVAPYSMD